MGADGSLLSKGSHNYPSTKDNLNLFNFSLRFNVWLKIQDVFLLCASLFFFLARRRGFEAPF